MLKYFKRISVRILQTASEICFKIFCQNKTENERRQRHSDGFHHISDNAEQQKAEYIKYPIIERVRSDTTQNDNNRQ